MMMTGQDPNEEFMTPRAKTPRATGEPRGSLNNRPSLPNGATSARSMGGGKTSPEQFNSHPNDLDSGSTARIGSAAKTMTTARRSGRGGNMPRGSSNTESGAARRTTGGGGGKPTQMTPAPSFKGIQPGRATPRGSGPARPGPSTYGSAGNRGGSNRASGGIRMQSARVGMGSASVARGSKR